MSSVPIDPQKTTTNSRMISRSGRASTSRVSLATAHSAYDVLIGSDILPSLARRIYTLTQSSSPRLFVVTSPEIWQLWSQSVLASFPHDRKPTVLFLPAGEAHKRLSAVEELTEQLACAGADRDSVLLAVGGGVIGDITGFVAAIYMRGIRYLQIPTTFLAQVDSSVGGKTGVNLRAGKNLLGSFHHPLAVLADVSTLRTLPARELRAGLQESIKAGVIRSPGLFRYLEANAPIVLDKESFQHESAIFRVIVASVRVKAEVVAADERESGLRMILNFGHTLGHAIEAATEYKTLLHGEAVAWGSIAAVHLALTRGALTKKDARRIEQTILHYGPLPRFTGTAQHLVSLTANDKKTRSGTRSFVLPTAIGKVEIVRDITDDELLDAAESMLALMRSLTASSTEEAILS